MPNRKPAPVDLSVVDALRVINDRLEGVTIQGLIVRATAPLAPPALSLAQLDTGLYAARAELAAATAEVDARQLRARLVGQYMDGTRKEPGHAHARPLSVSAAETASGRDPEYLTAKHHAAELRFYAEAARAVQRSLDVLTALGGEAESERHLYAVQAGAN